MIFFTFPNFWEFTSLLTERSAQRSDRLQLNLLRIQIPNSISTFQDSKCQTKAVTYNLLSFQESNQGSKSQPFNLSKAWQGLQLTTFQAFGGLIGRFNSTTFLVFSGLTGVQIKTYEAFGSLTGDAIHNLPKVQDLTPRPPGVVKWYGDLTEPSVFTIACLWLFRHRPIFVTGCDLEVLRNIVLEIRMELILIGNRVPQTDPFISDLSQRAITISTPLLHPQPSFLSSSHMGETQESTWSHTWISMQ
jgi:hypothetical protein